MVCFLLFKVRQLYTGVPFTQAAILFNNVFYSSHDQTKQQTSRLKFVANAEVPKAAEFEIMSLNN